MDTLFDISVQTIDGETITLDRYKQKVILIVNVASKWGATNQYEGLEDLYKKHGSKGLVVLGFPCNQFKAQEPENEEKILEFCRLTYGVSFPMFAKIQVNGKYTHPLYVYLKKERPGILGSGSIKWNFTKFLVDRDGKIIKRYGTATTPQQIEPDILELL